MRLLPVLFLLLMASILSGCLDDSSVDPAVGADGLLDLPVALGTARHMPVTSFEPTIGITASGALFVTAGNTSAGPTHQTLFRSRDGGQSWEDVTDNIAGVTNYPPNSNDPYVYVDTDTDRVYDFEMQGLSCNMLAYSDNEGETWTRSPLGCTPTQGLQDHQTIFSTWPRTVMDLELDPIGYPKVLHYCVNRVADTACAQSWDGGLTWGPIRALVYDGIDEDDVTAHHLVHETTEVICSGLSAHGAGGPAGHAYLPRGDCGGIPTVAISTDNGLNWQHVVISEDVLTYNADSFVPYHEVTIAVDEAGHVYSAWKGEDRRVKFAASFDRGYTWEPAIDVTPEGVNITDFPVITAGAEGRVAIAFVGTDADPYKEYGDMDIDDHWHAYLVMGTELHDADNATWESVQVNEDDDPIARGVCGGTRCQAGRGGLGDFIDVEIDPEGRPWGVFVDVCHQECIEAEAIEEGANSVHDFGLGMVGTITQGTSLRGDLLPLPLLGGVVPDTDTEAPA